MLLTLFWLPPFAVTWALFRAGDGAPPMSVQEVTSAFAGVAALFLIGSVVKTRDGNKQLQGKIDQILSAIYGPPEQREPSGLVHESKRVHAKMEEVAAALARHTADETVWQADLVRNATLSANRAQAALTNIDTRLENVEAKLVNRKPRRE